MAKADEGIRLMGAYESPQTGSEYLKVSGGDMFVSFRDIGKGVNQEEMLAYLGGSGEEPKPVALYRVRIQGSGGELTQLSKILGEEWGEVKDGDHLSKVVGGYDELVETIEAARALLAK